MKAELIAALALLAPVAAVTVQDEVPGLMRLEPEVTDGVMISQNLQQVTYGDKQGKGNCKDSLDKCDFFAQNGWCDTWWWTKKDQCQLSCGVCDGSEAPCTCSSSGRQVGYFGFGEWCWLTEDKSSTKCWLTDGTLFEGSSARCSSMDCRPQALAVGANTFANEVGGHDRTAKIYVPAACERDSSGAPCRMVFGFHGASTSPNPENGYFQSMFQDAAEEHGFILVSPAGLNTQFAVTGAPNKGWNFNYHRLSTADDEGFVKHLVEYISERAHTHSGFVFGFGHSSGANFLYYLVKQTSSIFTAISPSAGSFMPTTLHGADATPTNPYTGTANAIPTQPYTGIAHVSVQHFHSELDCPVPFQGGPTQNRPMSSSPDVFVSAKNAVEFVADLDECTGDTITPAQSPTSTTDMSALNHRVWQGCTGGTKVELYVIPPSYYTQFGQCKNTLYSSQQQCEAAGCIPGDCCSKRVWENVGMVDKWNADGHSLNDLEDPIWEKRVEFFMSFPVPQDSTLDSTLCTKNR